MIRLYFQQALYHLRENPIITWVSVLGTALAICMIMVLVITFQVRLVDCEPEVNRSRSLYVSAMSVKNKGGSDGDSSNARMSVRTGRECYMLVIAILLLVPAINLSSMTLSRMRRRMAEIGVRKAFGATGGELIRQIFFENLLLTLFAGVLGLALSYAATFLLNGFLFNNSTNAYLSGETALTPGMLLSPWAFLAAFGFCLLMNILSAGIPAWRASRMNITDAINQR